MSGVEWRTRSRATDGFAEGNPGSGAFEGVSIVLKHRQAMGCERLVMGLRVRCRRSRSPAKLLIAKIEVPDLCPWLGDLLICCERGCFLEVG